MKDFIAAAVCALPLAMGSMVHAQGTKGPSGSGAENPAKQSRDVNTHRNGPSNAETTRPDAPGKTAKPGTETNRPGSPDSMTSAAPTPPATPRTTEPNAGHNRSASGDSAGTEPRARDDQGAR